MTARTLLMSKAPAAAGGFPVIEEHSTATETELTTSHTIDKPTGTASGDLLVLLFAIGGTANRNIEVPSGWSRRSPDADRNNHVLTSVAGGSEPSSYTFTTTGNVIRSASIMYRISGAHGAVEWSGRFGFDADPFSPSWGSADTLWIGALRRRSATDIAAATPPTDFTDAIYVVSAAAISDAALDAAERSLATGTLDPDAWTATTGTSPLVTLLAVRPA